jgi:hypothetical protein
MPEIKSINSPNIIVSLPETGLHGNTHMLMQDKNNLKVADYLINWIQTNVH